MSVNVSGNVISSTGFDTTGNILNTPSVVTSGLVLWLDAGNNASYINSSNYYDCGYGCQYYASNPGCTNCNTQWKDMSGFGNDGGLTVAAISYSNIGGAFSFNGSSAMVLIPNNTVFDTQTFTIECWFKPTSLNQQGFLFEKGTLNTQYSVYMETGNILNFRTWSLSNQDLAITTTTYLSTTNWNHVCCTFGAGTKTIYVNGVQANQATSVTGTSPTNSGGISIGVYGGYSGGRGYYFNGSISVHRNYNKSLSADEVLQNFNTDRQRFGI